MLVAAVREPEKQELAEKATRQRVAITAATRRPPASRARRRRPRQRGGGQRGTPTQFQLCKRVPCDRCMCSQQQEPAVAQPVTPRPRRVRRGQPDGAAERRRRAAVLHESAAAGTLPHANFRLSESMTEGRRR